ncbi:MAG: hypothetical protein AAF790_10095 [Planctomycetota bacterium]
MDHEAADAEGRSAETDPAWGADEAGVVYRSISGAAIAGVLLGLLSPAALIAPVLVVVPLAAAAVCLAALRSIRANREVLTGQPAAVIGLALAVASLSAVAARDYAYKRLIAEQGRPTAELWIELVASGRLDESFFLTIPAGQRLEGQGLLASGEGEEGVAVRRNRREYGQRGVIRALEGLGPGAVARCVGPIELRRLGPKRLQAAQTFIVEPAGGVLGPAARGGASAADDAAGGVANGGGADAAAGGPVEVSLVLQRTALGGGPGDWHVADFSGPADGAPTR